MNICMVGMEIGFSETGAVVRGHANNVIRLAKCFASQGHKVYIITNLPSFSCKTFYDRWLPWATSVPFRTYTAYPSSSCGIEFSIKTLKTINMLHKKYRFDVINVHSGYPDLAILTYLIKKFSKCRSVHTLYCPITKAFSVINIDTFILKALASIDRIIAISKNIKVSLQDRGIPSDNIRIIQPSIDLSRFNPRIDGIKVRKHLKIDENTPIVLFIGNLSKSKGLNVLIDSISIMKDYLENFHLLIVLNDLNFMNEFLLQQINKIKEHNLLKYVTFIGISGDINEIIAASDVFVSPFLDTIGPADYPLTLLEAMAMAKPVIATRVGGIPEIVNDHITGLLVQPNDPYSLAEAIVYLIRSAKTRQYLGKNAATFVSHNFSVDKIAEEYLKVIS